MCSKLVILFVLFFNIHSNDFKLVLKAIDFDDNQVSEVAIGVPFLIKLIIESSTQFNDIQKTPVFEKIENGSIKSAGFSTSIRTINGRTTVIKTYQYDVRIDKEGLHNLGPAKIQINGHTYQSNILKLNVVNAVDNTGNKVERAILKLDISKQNLFLNEHAILSIKFYYQDEQIRLINIENPELKDFSFDKFELVSSGQEEINGHTYYFQKFDANIYPKKTGELLIPSVTGYYEESKNNLNMIMNFFNQIHRKQINSQALKINVKPLPPIKEKIAAVGQFKSFNASVNQNEVLEGEGIVFKLELQGQGDFNNISITQLDLPEQFKYYDSKNYITTIDDELKIKTFEFILQANKAGEFAIPSQKFKYFDTQNEQYAELKTKPILVQIKPLTEGKLELQENKEELDQTVNDKNQVEPGTSFPTNKKRFINFYLFLFLVLVPVIIKLVLIIQKYCLKKYKPDCLKKLQKSLNRFELKTDKNNQELYKMFIEYFANKFNVNQVLVNQEFIQEMFRHYNFTNDMINKWNLFYIRINELAYGSSREIDQDLIEEAKVWIIIFNEKFKE